MCSPTEVSIGTVIPQSYLPIRSYLQAKPLTEMTTTIQDTMLDQSGGDFSGKVNSVVISQPATHP